MNWLRGLIVAAFCIATPASAWWQSIQQVSVGGAPPAGYVGVGDLSLSVTILSYNGVRCYQAASTGNVIDVADTATGNTTGTRLKCDGVGNLVAVVGSTCSFVAGGLCSSLATTCVVSCTVIKLYDQSGKNSCSAGPCDLTGTGPLFLPNTQNGYGAMRSSGSTLVSAGTFGTVNQPVSVSTVAGKRTDTSGGSMLYGAFSSLIVGYLNGANTGDLNAGSNPTFTMSDAVYHSLQAIANGSSSQACVDSSACNTGLASGSNGLTGNPVQMFSWFGNNAFDAFEGALFSGSFSAGDITALTNNQHGTSGYNF